MRAEIKYCGKTDTVVFSQSSVFAGLRIKTNNYTNHINMNSELQSIIQGITTEEKEYIVSEDIRILFYIYSFPDSPETTSEILRYKGMILTEVIINDIGLSITITL